MSVRYMKASTAHRCTAGGTLASSSPRVALSSLAVGSMLTRWSWCNRQILDRATQARERTFGLGERRKAWGGGEGCQPKGGDNGRRVGVGERGDAPPPRTPAHTRYPPRTLRCLIGSSPSLPLKCAWSPAACA
jgi:hypothetical protein